MNLSVRSSNTWHRKPAIAIAIAGSLLLVQPSCIPPLRDPMPGPILPETFMGGTSPENSAQVRIEEFFNDPLLTNLIYQALVGNQELRMLAEGVLAASNEILARQGAYQPSISPGGSAGMTRPSRYSFEGAVEDQLDILPGQRFPNPLPELALGSILFWTPDIWWQLHNARDAAKMRYFAAGEGRNYVVTTVIAQVADNYYGLIALDKRMENLNNIIQLQQQSLEIARARMEAARSSALPVRRFEAEVRKNQSQRLIVRQDIIQTENRINFLAGRFPQPVARVTGKTIDEFIDLNLHALNLGVPAQLLQNRPDIRQAERELAATGLDVLVARKRFYPQGFIYATGGYEAFNPRYLFINPEALAAQALGNMLVPFINRKAIRADYYTANARQLQAVYNYQRVVLNAYTEVINRVTKVVNYGRSIEIKKQQVEALVAAVEAATSLYQNPRFESPVDYLDVLTAQAALFDARRDLIDTKWDQLSAIVNTYQALGGGAYLAQTLLPQWPRYQHKWNFIHLPASGTAEGGPVPLQPPPPPPTAAARGPVPLPSPPTGAAGGPVPLQPPPPPPTGAAGGPVPPLAPGAARGAEPLPTPAAETSPEPLAEPLPTPRGGGNGSGTGPRTPDPPR